jgi:putative transposase
MNTAWKLKLSVNDWIEFEDERHQVTRLRETVVHLRSESGVPQIIAVAALVADPTFQAKAVPPDKPAGPVLDHTAILDGLPAAERTRVTEMQAHLHEVTPGSAAATATPPPTGNPAPSTPRTCR